MVANVSTGTLYKIGTSPSMLALSREDAGQFQFSHLSFSKSKTKQSKQKTKQKQASKKQTTEHKQIEIHIVTTIFVLVQ